MSDATPPASPAPTPPAAEPRPGRPGRARARRLAVGLGLAGSLLVVEVGARFASRVDDDGNVTLRGRALRSTRLPARRVAGLARALAATPGSYAQYDADLGWSIRPRATSREQPYASEGLGIRAATTTEDVALAPAPGVLRIVLLGDSFTHGDEVPFAETWGERLEALLRERGASVEVVNLGVGGHGLDQAVLRHEVLGRRLGAKVVVLGLQPEDARRALNVIRPLYDPRSGLPFTKPRVLPGGEVVNRPALPPEGLVDLLERDALESWPPFAHERYLAASDRAWRPWRVSRVLAFVEALAQEREARRPCDPASEAGALALELIARLDARVKADGARLVVVHLPPDMPRVARGEPSPERALLDAIAARWDLVDPTPALAAAARDAPAGEQVVRPFGHYGPRLHAAVAGALAEHLAPR